MASKDTLTAHYVQDIWHALTHPLQYSGRASRGEYWGFTIFMYLVVIGVAALTSRWHSQVPPVVAGLLLFPSFISVTVRRLHDTDRPGTNALYYLIPFIGGFWVWAYCVGAGDPAANRYGLPPS